MKYCFVEKDICIVCGVCFIYVFDVFDYDIEGFVFNILDNNIGIKVIFEDLVEMVIDVEFVCFLFFIKVFDSLFY